MGMEEKEEERARMDEACDIYEYMEGRKEGRKMEWWE